MGARIGMDILPYILRIPVFGNFLPAMSRDRERESVCGVGICLEFYAVADDLGDEDVEVWNRVVRSHFMAFSVLPWGSGKED